MPEATGMTRELEDAFADVGRRKRVGVEAAFRATVQARLRNLEDEIDEVKTRLNGLLFFLAGTVIAQLLLRFWS